MPRTVAILLVLGLCTSAHAAERRLSSVEVAKVQRICRSLLGIPVDSRGQFARALAKFRPYTRKPQDIDELSFICSADCRGTLRLIDSTEVQISHSNIPPKGPGHLHDRVETVRLIHHGAIVLSLPARTPNKSLEATAGRSVESH